LRGAQNQPLGGASNPAIFEEETVGHVAWAASMSLVEAGHGEPTQDGSGGLDWHVVGAGLFPAVDSPNATDRPGDGAAVRAVGPVGLKTSRGASRVRRP